MQIVHITKTPLAGAPIRIVHAINSHTKHSARLINLTPNAYKARTFPEDLSWYKDKSQCLDLISNADILHFHHFMDLKDNPFGVNFLELAPNAKIIRHFHSDLAQLSIWGRIEENVFLEDDYQKVVIPHYPERTFLKVPILPNIIPINSKKLQKENTNNKKLKVVFSSSSNKSRFALRWNTKGYREVSKKLKQLSKTLGFEYVEIMDIPYEKAMELKKQSDIVIGDIVTGSYHLTELEGLAQGKVVLSYLDARSVQTLMNTFKCKDIPFVNTQLEYIEPILKELINSTKLRQEIGDFSRKWIEKYYDDAILVKEFINIYEKILDGQNIIREDAQVYPIAKEFLYNKIHDLKWEIDKNRLGNKFFSKTKTLTHRIIKILGLTIKIKRRR